jgi:DNA-directed RNA polymerase specialized sigma54-like protein
MSIANTNPGNIRATEIRWLGETDLGGQFEAFDSAENGLRALCLNLLAYQRRLGLHTISQIIACWAPPSENDTEAYIRSVCRQTAFDPHMPIDLTEPSTMRHMIRAIVQQENGRDPYTDAQIDEAMRRAGLKV